MTTSIQEWEEQLSKAGILIEGLSSDGDSLFMKIKESSCPSEVGIYDQEKLKAFIRKTLDAQRAEMVEMGEGLKKEQDGKATISFADGTVADVSLHSDMALGYNAAIEAYQEAIKNKI